MPNKYINKLQGKRVLVFGGTSGIGYGVVESAIEHGATVIVSGSNMPKLERTKEKLLAEYPDLPANRVQLRDCNLADSANQEANIKALLDAVTDGGKNKLDHVVHTAGDALGLLPVTDFTTETWLKISTVRVLTSIFIAKFANQYVEWSADSSITFTSGVNGHKPGQKWSIMAATGGAVEAFTRGAAVDLSPVRVNSVSPGAIKTELFSGITPEAERRYEEKTWVKRLGRPTDTAEAYSKWHKVLEKIVADVYPSLLHEGWICQWRDHCHEWRILVIVTRLTYQMTAFWPRRRE
jgi:NAD(P)-dependent dehydrogenase (short-subunit alcohol dehydrogenase family)